MSIVRPKSMNSLRLVKVAYVWPEAQAFDGICIETGQHIRSILVATPYGGTDFGFTGGIPAPEQEGWEENEKTDPDRRDVIAVVSFTCGGMPICIGYMPPQVTHMAFTKEQDKNRMIERHTSDFYRTVSDDGDMDMVHPSNAFIRVGEGTTPDNLEQRDFDKRWKIKHNTDKDVVISLQNGDAFIRIYPDRIRLQIAPEIFIDISPEMIQTTHPTTIFEDSTRHISSGPHTDAIGVHVPQGE